MQLTGLDDARGRRHQPGVGRYRLVRVDTDAGIYGIGEAGNFLGDEEGSATAASG